MVFYMTYLKKYKKHCIKEIDLSTKCLRDMRVLMDHVNLWVNSRWSRSEYDIDFSVL